MDDDAGDDDDDDDDDNNTANASSASQRHVEQVALSSLFITPYGSVYTTYTGLSLGGGTMAQCQGPRTPKGTALNTTVTKSKILAQNAPVTVWRPCSPNPLAD